VADRPGALVQLDTLTITLQPGTAIKQFTAYGPHARWTVAKAAARATSTAAAAFLDKVLADMPFPVSALQVDGGSEFVAAFENRLPGLAAAALRPAAQVAQAEGRGRARQRQLALRVLRR